MRAGRPWFIVLAVVAAAAGCTSAPTEADPVPPVGEALASADEPVPANNTTALAAFPRQETDLSYTLYATAGAVDTGNMADASWEVAVPAGARMAKAIGNATGGPSVVVGALHLMIHLGTRAAPGDMIADASGGAGGLDVGPVEIPAEATTLVVMWHATAEPVGISALQSAHLAVEFA
ncbi:MAG TPA: hypothetical protein VGR28_10250 [Candidatus Thermoplasmatota archaeon]|jgi:hypothetical protein|nr:hypothetical protein [Candidatus Thermoplasmatota archaeon]